MRTADLVLGGLLSLRARKLRAALSALGIAIGIAAGVAVLGISASSKADLLSQLGAEANLLTVSAGQGADGSPAPLPLTAEAMIGRIPPVESVTAVGYVPGVTVLRTAVVPAVDSGGISVLAAQPGLLRTLGGSVAHGTFLNAATERYPAVVLGAVAAQTLGIDRVPPGTQVYLGGRYFTVIGIGVRCRWPRRSTRPRWSASPWPARCSPSAAIRPSFTCARCPARCRRWTACSRSPRTRRSRRACRRARLSSILAARAAAGTAFTGLFLALGVVAAAVGGVGIANIMVISVLERRTEVGLRRALGAARWHVGTQFLVESLLLSVLGGAAGVLLGAAATAGYAIKADQPAVLPAIAVAAGLGIAAVTGALAGVYPAVKAARLAPAEALRAV